MATSFPEFVRINMKESWLQQRSSYVTPTSILFLGPTMSVSKPWPRSQHRTLCLRRLSPMMTWIASKFCHATHKNSKYTDVICLGSNSHKVLHYETVTRGDDPCVLKHESLGTQRIYNHPESQENGNVYICVHCRGQNASGNKWIKDNRPNTDSTNDTWHVAKNVAKEVHSVCVGPHHLEGKTWHPQLLDKAASVKTDFYWCTKNCEQDPLQLKAMILNITEHYKNHHGDCHPSSCYKTDANYEPSKTIISDSNAELLLCNVLERMLIYKLPRDFVHCMDTYLVKYVAISWQVTRQSLWRETLQVSDRLVRSWQKRPYKQQASDFNKASNWSEKSMLEDKKYCFGGKVWQEYTAIYLRRRAWSDISCICLRKHH